VTFHPAIVFIHESNTDHYLESVQKPFETSTIYPNPSNSSFAIRFFVPHSVHAEVIVYNLLGQQISRIAGQMFSAGWHDLQWNANDSPSGIYLAVFSTPTYQMTKKLILLK
jgi:hypothetical protein